MGDSPPSSAMDKLTPLLARVSLGKRESLSRDSPSPSVPVGKENASDALSDATACAADRDGPSDASRPNLGPTPHAMRELKRQQQEERIASLAHGRMVESPKTPSASFAVPEPAPVLVITAPTGELHITGPTHQEAPGRLDALVGPDGALRRAELSAELASLRWEESERPAEIADLLRVHDEPADGAVAAGHSERPPPLQACRVTLVL